MLVEERRAQVLRAVCGNGVMGAKTLSEMLRVSVATIRRDLTELERRGLLRRTRGGALAVRSESNGYEPPYHLKSQLRVTAKARIAELAASLVRPGDTVILDSGSTTYQLAKRIKGMSITVIALDVVLAAELAREGNADVVVVGGQVRRGLFSIVGWPGEEMLRTMHVDKTFLSADSVDLDLGITNVTVAEVPIKQMAAKAATQTILVADSTKFGKASPFRVCGLDSIHRVITDSGIPGPFADSLRARDIILDIASVD